MKKRILFAGFFIFISNLFCDNFPLWYENKNLQFPDFEYISAVGTGYNEAAAKDSALSELALYFESKISVQRSVKFYGSESLSGNSFGNTEKQRSVYSETNVASETSLPAVSFTNSFFNSVRNEYSVCAYIKKSDAASEFQGILSAGILNAAEKIKKSENSKNTYLAFSAAKSTLVSLEKLRDTAQSLSVLDAKSGSESLKSVEILSERADCIMSREKPKLTFSVEVKNDAEKNVAYTVQQLLESKGFVCGIKNPNFLISGNVHFSESKNAVGVFVRPAISLQVFSADGGNEVLDSYSRQYPKYGHRDLSNAYAKARVEIEKDLKENFIDSLF
ncbi:hypothetical protein [uncultured Treponema sp.]|uniref:hypothetical protein n=1 Tax=uncultured Treponema sp. TaxID=162155 RepID=UPI0025CE6252|nr:hypothetical protein [uncultured Treponema sp.]